MSYPARVEGLGKYDYCMWLTPCLVFSLNVEEVSNLLRFFSYLLLLMIFGVSIISLILSLFLSSSWFFFFSVNSSGLFLLYIAMYARGFSLLCFFRFLNSLYGIFSANSNLLLFVPDIGLAVRVFANGPGDQGSIPGRVIPKTKKKKMVLDASLLNTQHYKVWIKGKVEQPREVVAPSHTPWCSSYRKGSLRVTLDYGRQLYFVFFIIKCCWVSCLV